MWTNLFSMAHGVHPQCFHCDIHLQTTVRGGNTRTKHHSSFVPHNTCATHTSCSILSHIVLEYDALALFILSIYNVPCLRVQYPPKCTSKYCVYMYMYNLCISTQCVHIYSRSQYKVNKSSVRYRCGTLEVPSRFGPRTVDRA